MGKSSGGAPQMMMMPSQQTTTNQLPQWVQDAGKANYDAASNMSPQAFAPYSGLRVADINQWQWDALGKSLNNMGASNGAYDQASKMTQGALNDANSGLSNASNAYNNVDTSAIKNSIAGLGNAAQMGYNQVAANGNPIEGALQALNYAYNPYGGGADGVRSAMSSIGQSYNPVYQATNPSMNALSGSIQDARSLQGYNPQQVQAQTLPQGDISQYLNPYTQNVIDSSLATLDQQRKNALNTNADSAINAKAFGGSRQGVQDAATNAQYGMQAGQLAANLNNQNFAQAQQAMQADQARNLQAQLANQSAGLQGNQLNQSATQLTGNLANTLGNLGLNTGQFNIQAANALGNLGLQNAQTGINAANTTGTLGLNSRAQDINAQQANQSAALQKQANAINAYQGAGSLGNSAANIALNQANGLANIANTQGQLGLAGAGQIGDIATAQQNAYLNSVNAGLGAANQISNWQNAKLGSEQQAYNEWQNAILAPLNLRMSALGQTPYNTSTNTSGFTTQAYQPTSSSPLMTGLGAGMSGLSFLKNMGGLSGLAGLFSDENAKTDIEKLGKDEETGLDMYAYRYKNDPKSYPKVVGPMAQDVERHNPDAVKKIGGKRVIKGLI